MAPVRDNHLGKLHFVSDKLKFATSHHASSHNSQEVIVKLCVRRLLALVFCISMVAFLEIPAAHSQSPTELPLMPMPLHITQGDGRLKIDGAFTTSLDGYKDARLESARRRFLNILSRETGIPYHDEVISGEATLVVQDQRCGVMPVQRLGQDESYHLEVTPTHALITAPNPLGAMHGLQTFLQLVAITPDGFSAPVVTIDDEPRFPWRGLMIDVEQALPAVGRHRAQP